MESVTDYSQPGRTSVRLKVLVDLPRHSPLDPLLDYLAPEPWPAGTLVRVPLGQREVLGVVWDGAPEPAPGVALRPITAVLDALAPLPADWRALVAFAARYYQRATGEVALASLPPALRDLDGVQLARRLQRKAPATEASPAETPPTLSPEQQQVLAQIEAEVPSARRATDSAGRETDIAIDHSEFTHLPQDAIDHAVRLMRAAGMNATVSSIHINGWFGDHNKLEGARWIVRELWGRNLDAEMDRWVYVGDSTNDQLMFQHFEHSVGVANVARFVPQLQHLPRYVTQGERGAGFAELVQAILANR